MNKGFTTIEIISVIVILGLLVIITTPAYDNISNNIKERTYASKKSAIKKETTAFAEKYLKDKIYSGIESKNKISCFTVNFLIKNGIISSDDNKEEYILNERDNIKYADEYVYIKMFYDYEKLKLVSLIEDESYKIDDYTTIEYNNNCDVTY